MPLHDWSDDSGWENFHALWTYRLFEDIQPRLPAGYQVVLGSHARAGLRMAAKPDVAVTNPFPTAADLSSGIAPDDEVPVATLEPGLLIQVQRRGEVVAVIELVSPGNKDRHSEQAGGVVRYAGYLRAGIHLVLVDVHHAPAGFSFPDGIAADLGLPNQPAVPPPAGVVYRVGGRASQGGSYVAVWRRPFQIGRPLPSLPLPLDVGMDLAVDLEDTYMQAVRRAYLLPPPMASGS